jgi:hypothetical protein
MQTQVRFKDEKEFKKFLKNKTGDLLCKSFGHNYCPGKIEVECGAAIVNIEFKCRRCGRIYRKLYPAKWDGEVDP